MLHEQRKQSERAVVSTSTQTTTTPRVHSAAPDWTGLGFDSEKVLKEETVRWLDADKLYWLAT